MHATGRPVLIGTRSIDKSEHLSRAAARAAASSTRCSTPTTSPTKPRSSPTPAQPGKVTVSTNMAGRGTDIKLGDGVAELGGLHVICTEMHDSARIDRQLIGRCGRQGDPGTLPRLPGAGRRPAAGLGAGQGQVLQRAGQGVARVVRSSERPLPQGAAGHRDDGTSATARC